MFDKQSDFTGSLAKKILEALEEYPGANIELQICQWLLDNNVRFRNAGITPCTARPTHEQSQK